MSFLNDLTLIQIDLGLICQIVAAAIPLIISLIQLLKDFRSRTAVLKKEAFYVKLLILFAAPVAIFNTLDSAIKISKSDNTGTARYIVLKTGNDSLSDNIKQLNFQNRKLSYKTDTLIKGQKELVDSLKQFGIGVKNNRPVIINRNKYINNVYIKMKDNYGNLSF